MRTERIDGGGSFLGEVFPSALETDGALILNFGERAQIWVEVLADGAGRGAALRLGDVDVLEPFTVSENVAGHVAAEGHVIEIGEEADVAMIGFGDERGALSKTVDEVALAGIEAFDDDDDVVGLSQWRELAQEL